MSAKGRLQTGPLPHLRRLRFRHAVSPALTPESSRHPSCDGAAKGGAAEPNESLTMITTPTLNLAVPEDSTLGIELTSTGRRLDDVLDAWLADDFAHDDWVHVHSWTDDEREMGQ